MVIAVVIAIGSEVIFMVWNLIDKVKEFLKKRKQAKIEKELA